MNIVCRKFLPLERNTLKGFATIYIGDIDAVVHDVAVLQKGNSRWAAPPAKPLLKDGVAIKDENGKIKYSPVLEFPSREARDAFSQAVINAVLKTADGARALGEPADAIPF